MNPDSVLYGTSVFQISLMSSVEFGMQTPGVEFSAGSIKKELNVSELNATFTISFIFSSCITYGTIRVQIFGRNITAYWRDTIPLKVNDTVQVLCDLRTARYVIG